MVKSFITGRKELEVMMHGKRVGELTMLSSGLVEFRYDRGWLEEGFPISPISLPFHESVFIPEHLEPFDGLFGIFQDSLPDGWGRILTDRMLLKMGYDLSSVNVLDRLSLIGTKGMGALEYYPQSELCNPSFPLIEIEKTAMECHSLLSAGTTDSLEELYGMGSRTGGTRPKIFLSEEGEEWIVKFPSLHDHKEIGREEYEYMKAAGLCGLRVPEAGLLPCGHYAVKRFDVKNGKKVHMASVSSLLEVSHRIPALDYDILLRLTAIITGDRTEVELMYRHMCFNVFSHNRDDHSNNFSFLYDEEEKRWHLSPAYDLTWSTSLGGEHATSVGGNGKDPDIDDAVGCGIRAGLDEAWCRVEAIRIKEIVSDELSEWLHMKR